MAAALGNALSGAVKLTANTVNTTIAIADTAVTAVGKVGTAGATAVGVLGEGTLKASQVIGTAALDATSTISSATLGTASKVTGTALDVTAKTVDASGKIANAATGAAATIASGALDATSKLSTAATGTAATIGVSALTATEQVATTGLKTAASTTVTTTEQVGKALTAGINLAGNTTANILVGLDTIRGIVAKKAANTAAISNQSADAKANAIRAGEGTVIKAELLKAFDNLDTLTRATLVTLDGVQKTALIGKMNIYKKLSCMAIKRWMGLCKSGEIGADLAAATKFQSTFTTVTTTAYGTAKTAVATGAPYDTIVSNYEQAIATAVTTFVQNYKTLHDKYDALIEKSLATPTGGRRTRRSGRRAARNKRVHRTSRVLPKHFAKRR
jgi:hypothetical protein